MAVVKVGINCDTGLPGDGNFTASQLEFTLSEPDYDTLSGEVIPAATDTLVLGTDGAGFQPLWPVTRGVRNTFYTVVLIGSRRINGAIRTERFTLGTIRPPGTGAPFNLSDLLAQSSGGIAVGSIIYATLADAVAAAQAAAAAGADPIAATAAAEAAEAAADAAEASALAIGTRFYGSEAAFTGATIPALVNIVFIRYIDEVLAYVRSPGASGPDDISHPNGSDWAKATLTNADLIAAVTDIITAGQFPTYAEGAFTPVFTWSDFSAGSVSGGATSGSFVREGRMVYIDASFVGITVARVTDSGTIRIGNLPYPAAANTFGSLHIRRCSGIDLRDTGSAPPMNATIAITAGQTYGTLTINPANAATFSAGVARCATGAGAVTLQVTGWYEVQD